MAFTTIVVAALIAVAVLLNVYLAARPSSIRERGGRILAFLGVFVLPVMVVAFGTQQHLEQSKSTQFCLSCHVMEKYGKSLYVDDNEYIPAVHFQNNRIPRDRACFTCHTEYTMYGDFAAKLRGLKHVWVQYVTGPPDTIHLYSAYQNRECLHCHSGARSFEGAGPHHETPGRMDSLKTNKMSCLTSGCHDVIHNVAEQGDVDFWKPDSTVAKGEDNGTSH